MSISGKPAFLSCYILCLCIAVNFVSSQNHSLLAQPTPIPVPNAGFEFRETYDPFPESTDKYNQWAQESWRHFEISHNGGPLRIWNPGVPGFDENPQGALDVGFEGEAPEGKYVMVVRSRYNDATNVPEDPQIRDFEAAVQILPETVFDPDKTYTLTAQVGRLFGSDNYSPDWHGYALQLAVGGTNVDGATFAGKVVGGTVIAEDYNSLEVVEDEFVLATAVYTPTDEHADLEGLPLQIRLVALENEDDHSLTGWVAFDDVKLTEEGSVDSGPNFLRGDDDANGVLEISDPILNLTFQFVGGEILIECMDAADFDDNGEIEITDPIASLSHQFLGTAPPAPPGLESCGLDPTEDDLDCLNYDPCE